MSRLCSSLGLLGLLWMVPLMTAAQAAPVAAKHLAFAPQRTTAEALAARQAKGEKLVIVDVRSASAYAQEHIYGARNVPSSLIARSLRALPHDQTLVLYCTCPEEHGSIAAARHLHDRYGYTKLAVLVGGLDAWREAGYKVVEVGASPTPAHVSPSWAPKPSPSVQLPTSPAPTSFRPTATPMVPPDRLDPMDERRGTDQAP